MKRAAGTTGAGLLLLLGASSLAPALAAGEPDPTLQSLLLAERAFARASVERGMREAFLEFLADDSVIFRAGPVDGRQWFEGRPPAEGRLSWEPLYADLSRGGDLGYTTGPWQFLPAEGEPSFGHYVTVWRKRSDGAWRVAADIGITHPRPKIIAGDLAFPDSRRSRTNSMNDSAAEAGGLEALRIAERDFGSIAAERGAEQACLEYGAESLRLYRDGGQPVTGRGPACRELGRRGERATAEPSGLAVSDSLDLGFVYGTLEFAAAGEGFPAGPGSFLRIWKESGDGVWKLVLDVAVPHAPAREGP